MSAAKKEITDRDVVLRERAAFLKGANFAHTPEPGNELHTIRRKWVAQEYPLPGVVRARVVRENGYGSPAWRFDDGGLQMQYRDGGQWLRWNSFRDYSESAPLPKRVAIWADLLANPTEEVEDLS